MQYQTNPLKNSNLALISLKGSVRSIAEQQTLINEICQIVCMSIPNMNDLKRDLGLLEHVVNLALNHSAKSEIDVKAVVLQVMIRLFPELNSEADHQLLSQQIDYIIRASKTVGKIGVVKKIFKSVSGYLRK